MTDNLIAGSFIYDAVIIGAGASGLFCAASADVDAKGANAYANFPADAKGAAIHKDPGSFRGLILEKTAHAGTKLLMSGSGQCNITHGGSIKDFISCYGDKGKKIRSCLYKHSNLSMMNFLKNNGIDVFERENGKVFPSSMNAADVLDMLLEEAGKNRFEIKYNSPVTGIVKVNEPKPGLPPASSGLQNSAPLWSVICGDVSYPARNVVIATGGCSYPSTGSDGSMFKVLSRDLDIEITKLKPALSSVQVNDYPYAELSGISFDKIGVSIWRSGRKTAETCEDLLFTHKDLSGPAVINISKYADPGDRVKINYLFPVAYRQALDRLKAVMHGAGGNPANIISSEFSLPKRFCQLITRKSGSSLKALAANLTGEEFIISSVSGFNRAMATAGGIDLRQIDTATFAFKEHPGLYAIGEALDVDGITGGYNLQFAYSSAVSAMAAICV